MPETLQHFLAGLTGFLTGAALLYGTRYVIRCLRNYREMKN